MIHAKLRDYLITEFKRMISKYDTQLGITKINTLAETLVDFVLLNFDGIEMIRKSEIAKAAESVNKDDHPTLSEVVFSMPDCPFEYCPNPSICKEKGCQYKNRDIEKPAEG